MAEAAGRELHAQAVTHAKGQHQLSEKVDGSTRERAALKTILESKVSTLVEGIKRDRLRTVRRRREAARAEAGEGETA